MCSYTRWGIFEGLVQPQILPKSGEKSRHQPVFFYARAEAEHASQSSALANGICVENAKTHNAFPHKSLPASAGRLPAVSPSFARSKKPSRKRKDLSRKRLTPTHTQLKHARPLACSHTRRSCSPAMLYLCRPRPPHAATAHDTCTSTNNGAT